MHRKNLSTVLAILALVIAGTRCYGSTPSGTPDESAIVRCNGRQMPLRSLCDEWLYELYGKTTYDGMSSVEVAFGWLHTPEAWMQRRFIRIGDKQTQQLLGCGRYACPADLFTPDGEYKLSGRHIPAADRKLELLQWMRSGAILRTFTAEKPTTRQRAELACARILPYHFTWQACLLTAAAIIILLIAKKDFNHLIFRLLTAFLLIFQTAFWQLRWYATQHIPLTDSYETLQFLSIAILLITTMLWRKNRAIPVAGMLLAGTFLWVATFPFCNPCLSPISQALDSPWLGLHVSVVMMAYALFAMTFALSIAALAMKTSATLTHLTHRMLLPAEILLAVGIATGALWAKSAWGSYWSWDPKEVWALVTLIAYLPSTLARHLPPLQRPAVFHLCTALAFAAVLITYFGAGILFGGLHTY